MRGGGRKRQSKGYKSQRSIKLDNNPKQQPVITLHRTPPRGSTIVLFIHGHGRFMTKGNSGNKVEQFTVNPQNKLHVFLNTAIGTESKYIGNHLALTIPTIYRIIQNQITHPHSSGRELIKSVIEELFFKHDPISRDTSGDANGLVPHRTADSSLVRNVIKQISRNFAIKMLGKEFVDKANDGLRFTESTTSPIFINKTYTFDDAHIADVGIKYRESACKHEDKGIFTLAGFATQVSGTSPRGAKASLSEGANELIGLGMDTENFTTPYDEMGVYKVYDSLKPISSPERQRFGDVTTTEEIFYKYKNNYDNIFILDFSCNGFSEGETVAEELCDSYELHDMRVHIQTCPTTIRLTKMIELHINALFSPSEIEHLNASIGLPGVPP